MGDFAEQCVAKRTQAPVEAYVRDLRKVCGLFDVEPASKNGLVAGNVGVSRFGRLDIARVRLNAQEVSRSKRRVRQDPGEHFFAIMQIAGQSQIVQNGAVNRVEPGDLCLVDSSSPSSFVYGGAFSDQVSFHLPRDEMIMRFGGYWRNWHRLNASKDWFPALSAVGTQLVTTQDHKVKRQLEESFFSLIGAALCNADANTHDMHSRLLSSALDLIDRHCSDPEYSSKALADQLGLSARSLQREFKRINDTPTQRILDARLRQAYGRLNSGSLTQPASVTEIAFDCGFSDLSYFHRTFRQKFGKTPGSLKREM